MVRGQSSVKLHIGKACPVKASHHRMYTCSTQSILQCVTLPSSSKVASG